MIMNILIGIGCLIGLLFCYGMICAIKDIKDEVEQKDWYNKD